LNTYKNVVCDNEKENWRILTNKEIYASVKKRTIIETIRLDYDGLNMYREWKKIEFPKSIIYEFGGNKIER